MVTWIFTKMWLTTFLGKSFLIVPLSVIAGIFPTSFSSALLKSFVIWLIQRERLLVEAKREGLQTCFKFRYSLSFILSSSYLLHYVYGFSVKCNQLIPPDGMNLIYIKQAEKKSCWMGRHLWQVLVKYICFFSLLPRSISLPFLTSQASVMHNREELWSRESNSMWSL